MEQQLEVKTAALEAYKARVHELEHILMANEDLVLAQKKTVNILNEQRFEKLEVNIDDFRKYKLPTRFLK